MEWQTRTCDNSKIGMETEQSIRAMMVYLLA